MNGNGHDLIESEDWTALMEFYRRSVRDRPTVERLPFVVQADTQQFDTHAFRPLEDPKVIPSAPQIKAPPAPTISDYFPYWCWDQGGATVDVHGTNFSDPSYVRLVVTGPTNVGAIINESAVNVLSDTHLTFHADATGFFLPQGYVLCEVQVSPLNNFPSNLTGKLASLQYEVADAFHTTLGGVEENTALVLPGGGSWNVQYKPAWEDASL